MEHEYRLMLSDLAWMSEVQRRVPRRFLFWKFTKWETIYRGSGGGASLLYAHFSGLNRVLERKSED